MKKLSNSNKLQLQTTYQIDPDFNSAKFIKMRLRVCHEGRNLNGSAFSVRGFDKAQPSIYNTPILGHVVFDENDQPQFGGHDWSVREDADGEPRVHYEEVPIGVVPENCNYSIEEYQGRHYVCVDAFIWREYSNEAEQIIQRDKNIQLSMEVDINDATYDQTYGVYNVTDYTYKGITFLGNDHTPAMAGAGATIAHYAETTTKAHFDKMWFALQSDLKDNVNEMEANTLSEEKTKTIEESPEQEEQFEEDTVDVSEEVASADDSSVNESKPEDAPAEEHEATSVKKSYALLSNIVESVSKGLSEYKLEYEGYECPKYWFEDIDTDKQLAYVYSMEDGYYYSVPYSIEGDSVALIRNFKRQVLSFRDYVAGQDPSLMPDSTRSECAAEAYVNLKKVCEDYEKELKELRTFQQETLSAQKQAAADALFETFVDLAGNEEFEALKAKATECELSELEKECYALRGKAVQTKFSAHKQSGLRVGIADYSEDAPSSRVAEMIASFKKG